MTVFVLLHLRVPFLLGRLSAIKVQLELFVLECSGLLFVADYPEQCDSQQPRAGSTSDNKTRSTQGDSIDSIDSMESDKPAVPETELDAQRLESKLVHQVKLLHNLPDSESGSIVEHE